MRGLQTGRRALLHSRPSLESFTVWAVLVRSTFPAPDAVWVLLPRKCGRWEGSAVTVGDLAVTAVSRGTS